MGIEILTNIPSWEWPEDTGTMLLGILNDDQIDESDRLLAAELSGDSVVINDRLADALLTILCNGDESEEIRGTAVISLGPALEDTEMMMGFEDADDELISEGVFHKIQKSLYKLFHDADAPENVRRKVLEASVRAPQEWHKNAVRDAYSGGDGAWRLTAVFCMQFIRGFNEQILKALESEDTDIHYHAVCASGSWEVGAAWSHLASLVVADDIDKELRLAAIDAIVGIRPREVPEILDDLIDSDDEDIVEAAHEALTMAKGLTQFEDDDDIDGDDEYF